MSERSTSELRPAPILQQDTGQTRHKCVKVYDKQFSVLVHF